MKTNQKTQTTLTELRTSDFGVRISPRPRLSLASRLIIGTALLLVLCGCQVLTYSSPTGERFTRSSLASSTAIQSLSFQSDTNGLRRVELRGYQNDSTQALSAVTEAAVRAALQSAAPIP